MCFLIRVILNLSLLFGIIGCLKCVLLIFVYKYNLLLLFIVLNFKILVVCVIVLRINIFGKIGCLGKCFMKYGLLIVIFL